MTTKASVPNWARKAAQGVTFWMGHRRCLYGQYPLGESAFVAELCSLIFSNLDTSNYTLRCEVMYRDLAGDTQLPNIFGPRSRADIVILERSAKKDGAAVPKFVIEVKRASASMREVNNDLLRLSEIGSILKECRLMLFIISEGRRPKNFVTMKGTSRSGTREVIGGNACYCIRSTAKAAHSLTRIENAHYASILEVYPLGKGGFRKKARAAINCGKRR